MSIYQLVQNNKKKMME